MPPSAINGLTDVELVARKKFTYSGSADTIQVNDTITNLFVIKNESGFVSLDSYFEKNKNNCNISTLLLRLKERPNQPVTLNYDIRARLYDGSNWTLPEITLKVK
ncbi:MAG: hypothetical protein H7329_00035 [Opitutaceae bacterium]|nr:hypothetical protein [Cytophagales bacterium]